MDRAEVFIPPNIRGALDALSLLSNKWEPVVVSVLLESGSLRFSELENNIPDISPNMLTKTLESLSEHGLVTRCVISESPLTVTYELTDAGRELRPVFDSLATWADEHIDSVQPTVVLGDRDHRLVELYRSWLCDRFDVIAVHGQESLWSNLAETPDVAIFDIDLWGDDPATLSAHRFNMTRRIALVGDRPDPSLCTWPCDDVLRKPLVKSELVTAVTRQLDRFGQPEPERERDGIEARLTLLESIYSRPFLQRDKSVSKLYESVGSIER